MDGHHLYAMTESGEIADYDLSTMRGFRHASPSQLGNFTVVNDKDIHWPDLGEDINLEGMLYDNHLCLLTATEDSVLYRPEPQSHDCDLNLYEFIGFDKKVAITPKVAVGIGWQKESSR